MITLEEKIELVMRYATTQDTEEAHMLHDKIVEVLSYASAESTFSMGDVIADLLKELGVPFHLKGYDQLIYAIELVISDFEYLDRVEHALYPAVAERFNTTSSRAARNIRRAIEIAWLRQDLENAYRIFGNTISPTKGKPTNSEFIACCARVVLRRMKAMNSK